MSQVTVDSILDQFAERRIEGDRPWRPPRGVGPFSDGIFFLGLGNPALEVCVVPAERKPRRDEVRELWRSRQKRQASPLLLISPFTVDCTVDVHLCGPTDADLTVREFGLEQAVGLAAGALAEPSGLAAVRYLHEHTPREAQDFQGLINQGMFAAHTLRTRVREMPGWGDAVALGEKARSQAGRALVAALGFSIEQSNTSVRVLRASNDQARAVAVFLDRDEAPNSEGGRFGDTSALSQAFTRADRDNIPFVIFTRGPEIRLYAASGYEGVGRKGQAETYVQANVSLLADDELGFLPLIFSAAALLDGGSFARILNWSRDFSADLSARLRDRVYKHVVPALAVAVAEEDARHDRRADRSLDDIYEETLVILFRLLFVAYAEDRDLLPYSTNVEYRRNSLKATGRALSDRVNEGKDWSGLETHAVWSGVTQLFEAVDKGNDVWSVPAYNGGLFSADVAVSQAGAVINDLKLSDEHFAPPLAALLTERGEDGVVGPVDFRSLSVRDFGTIYEGLLESSLSQATADLKLDARENYIPASGGDKVVVPEGGIYFHNRSGARKATGSYFTKHFAVEHLLERALEPTLDAHLERLNALLRSDKEDQAAQAFFDFRCADIAMGSGHFLVAAVDRIEKRLAQFLDENSIPAVEAELDRLRAAAVEHLGDSAAGYEIERRQLLRRQVARRCIYGADRNQLAVDLARLSLWVHTFVPGLPLSFLDHNLVRGDSLTGVGTVQEAVEYLAEQAAGKRAKHGQGSVFAALITDWLEQAKQPLIRLARASDATRAELAEVRGAQEEARQRAEPVRQLFDLVCAMRRGEASPFDMGINDASDITGHPQLAEAEAVAQDLVSMHFPVVLPEVFLRERPGFDCLIGNPPWEKLQVEEHSFYALHYPGLRGLAQVEAEPAIERLREERPDLAAEYEQETALVQRVKTALANGPFPGFTAGRPDLFKAFAWRFWHLLRHDGRVGIVLPRKALEASGMARWRQTLLAEGTFEDVTMLLNRGGWVFDDVEGRYTIGLIVIRAGRSAEGATIGLRGPFSDLSAYVTGMQTAPAYLSADNLLSWSDTATFPLLRDAESMRVFAKLREHPRLDEPALGWEPRGLRELNAHDDKDHFIFEPAHGAWPVYAGASFDLWNPQTGTMYAWADPDEIIGVLQARRTNQVRLKRSPFYGMTAVWAADVNTLPCQSPRIAWRDTARATDRRTVRVALVPPNVILVHQAYYLFWRQGTSTDVAYALGVLCSLPFDWYARQVVESHVTVEFMRASPVPRPPEDDPRRRRVIEIAGSLAAVDERYRTWANAVGVEVSAPSDDGRFDLVAELDAVVASLYGLTREDLGLVFETFHVGWDYAAQLRRTLERFDAL